MVSREAAQSLGAASPSWRAVAWLLSALALPGLLDAQTGEHVEVERTRSVTVTAAVGSRDSGPAGEARRCVPKEQNSVAYAVVDGEQAGDSVRLYFRRLHHVTEDFYYVPMRAVGEGTYLGVLPKPHDRRMKRIELENGRDQGALWARWWREKDASLVGDRDPNKDLDEDRIEREASRGGIPDGRTWMASMAEDQALEDWLEAQENEGVEYFAAVFDAAGRLVGSSVTPIGKAEVRTDCPGIAVKSVRQALPGGWRPEALGAENLRWMVAWIEGKAEVLTVGETAPWQRGEGLFHWKCDGIVSRIGYDGVYRPDEVCRACVLVVPVWLGALGPVVGTGALIKRTEAPEASPTTPVQ